MLRLKPADRDIKLGLRAGAQRMLLRAHHAGLRQAGSGSSIRDDLSVIGQLRFAMSWAEELAAAKAESQLPPTLPALTESLKSPPKALSPGASFRSPGSPQRAATMAALPRSPERSPLRSPSKERESGAFGVVAKSL